MIYHKTTCTEMTIGLLMKQVQLGPCLCVIAVLTKRLSKIKDWLEGTSGVMRSRWSTRSHCESGNIGQNIGPVSSLNKMQRQDKSIKLKKNGARRVHVSGKVSGLWRMDRVETHRGGMIVLGGDRVAMVGSGIFWGKFLQGKPWISWRPNFLYTTSYIPSAPGMQW